MTPEFHDKSVNAAAVPEEELVAELPVRVGVLRRDAPHGGDAVEECALPGELRRGREEFKIG